MSAEKAAAAGHLASNDKTGRECSASSTTLQDCPSPHDEESNADNAAEIDAEINDLARRLTTQSVRSGHGQLFPMAEGGPLDPNSEFFNARQWAKAYYRSRTTASDGSKPRTTGVAFKDLEVYGFGTPTDFQKTVFNIFLEGGSLLRKLAGNKGQRIDILRGLEGVVHAGEMLCVLGPPGSGCSTLLRTIAGDTHGFHVSQQSTLNYQGIRPEQMAVAYRGEAIYTAEVDHHFPHLTVGDTLYFAARSRCPPKHNIPNRIDRREYAEHLRDVIMAMFGISHTKNTRVGNDFVRGVSGGERKRVTIAEAALGFSPLQCWDNNILGISSCVAIYQAPQTAYEVFDKVIVLYEGRQIFFGRTDEAKAYFEALGFICPEQQTTPDFLTSMTNPVERVVRPGCSPPNTADEFAAAWRASRQRALLLDEVDRYTAEHPFDGEHHQRFFESRRIDQAALQRSRSPFNLSYWEQLGITLWRAFVLLKCDPSITITLLVANLFEALIIASIFYNLPENTTSFFRRSILIFFIVLMNAFSSILEIMTLYAKRKVVEKQARYAFYHPSAEALSAMVMDLPYKILNAIILNCVLYFMCNLRREAGAFFFFLLISFTLTLTMSMLFRFIGSITKTIAQALAPAGIILLALVLYTGFAIPVPYMQNWLGWLRWLNPVYYGIESAFTNEFVGRQFPCSDIVPAGPGYEDLALGQYVCNVPGAIPGQSFVDGATYLRSAFQFDHTNRWRNWGVLIAWAILFLVLHLATTEFISSERSKGEVLVFIREAMKKRSNAKTDMETGKPPSPGFRQSGDILDGPVEVEKQTAIFHWKDVCYDIKINGEPRRILDNVDGWVKPGTLTALMGVSGAGKTTLLDVLASRVTMGVVSGDMLVDGHQRDSSFQRKTGYVTQQDLHLATSTVREALTFSALLRQPAKYSKAEKVAYVDTTIELLNMRDYSDAIIGFPGEGLNVEQRKRLTIGVELVARPQLLLFLDEPTSGLDSQTSWSICDLMEKLTKAGQAILCTIHQPSAMLFQRFDRLLLLAKGGKTVYFGQVGPNSTILMDYFVRNGGPALPKGTNPAEHMLAVIGAAPGAHTDIDWPAVWRASPEYQAVQKELASLSSNEKSASLPAVEAHENDPTLYHEFAAAFSVQVREVTRRVFQQYWRSPSYMYSKFTLSAGAALFIGLSILNAENSARGLQNQMFGVFMFLSIFSQVSEQLMPVFCEQRTLYEARERPSKSYSWQAFMFANITVEIVWNSFVSVLCFICWYYPMGLYRNAEWTGEVHSRGITIFLHVWMFFLLSSSFGHLLISGTPNPDIAGGIQNLLFIMMFAFCGILAGPDQLPGFWIFMYRVNPFTYVVEAFMGTTLANAPVECASNEVLRFEPAGNGSTTCAEYLRDYMSSRGGYLIGGSGDSTEECSFCALADTNAFLANINVDYGNRWRNYGILWAYVIFNIAGAIFLYWLVRVPKTRKVKKE